MSYSITDLKEKLDPKNIKGNEYQKYFDELANMLMNHFIIAKGDDKYEFVEIEFYLFTPEHQDVITYPRKIVESKNPYSGKKEEKLMPMEAGQWFFHQSGVDITFKCDETRFGGILVRGIRRTSDSKIITGPLKCVYHLWDEFNAFTPSLQEYPIIIPTDTSLGKGIKSSKRIIRIPTSKIDSKIMDWIYRLPTNPDEKLKIQNKGNLKDTILNSNYRYTVDNNIKS